MYRDLLPFSSFSTYIVVTFSIMDADFNNMYRYSHKKLGVDPSDSDGDNALRPLRALAVDPLQA